MNIGKWVYATRPRVFGFELVIICGLIWVIKVITQSPFGALIPPREVQRG